MELLKKLSGIYCAGGEEKLIAEAIKNALAGFDGEIYSDTLGNLICKSDGGELSGKTEKTAVLAPMDAPGLIVTYIEENGSVRVHPLGNISFASVCYKAVTNGKIKGILYPDSSESQGFDKCHVNLGFKDRNEAELHLSQGTVLYYEKAVTELENGLISGAGISNLACCCSLIKAALEVKKTPGKVFYFIFTCQSGLAARGAYPAAFGVNPDNALCTSCYEAKELGIRIIDKAAVFNAELTALAEKSAEDIGVNLKKVVCSDETSEASRVQCSGTGVKTASVLMPVNHLNTASEIINTDNIDILSKIITQFLNNI